MYAFTLGIPGETPLLTTSEPGRGYSCGASPRATLEELQAYARQYPLDGCRFLVVDLTDIFDAVLVITGEDGTPVDRDQDVSLFLIGEDGFSEDGDLLVEVGGFTWSRMATLPATYHRDIESKPAYVITTAGAVREYVQATLHSADMGDDLDDWQGQVFEVFGIERYTPDAERVYGLDTRVFALDVVLS